MALDIIDKIRKLLALSTSPEPAEAAEALLAARKLMAEHNISESDVRQGEREVVARTMDRRVSDYEQGLFLIGNVIAKHHACACVFRYADECAEYRLVTFIGLGAAPEVCCTLTGYAWDAVLRAERTQCRRSPTDTDESYLHCRIAFESAFATALKMSYNEQSVTHDEWGLVLDRLPPEVEEYLANKTQKTTETPLNMPGWTRAYFYRGFRAGTEYARNMREGGDGNGERQEL